MESEFAFDNDLAKMRAQWKQAAQGLERCRHRHSAVAAQGDAGHARHGRRHSLARMYWMWRPARVTRPSTSPSG